MDFVEVFLPPEDIDKFLREHSERFVRQHEIEDSYFLIDRKRRERLMNKIYKAAAKCLTDRQFQIFILRYKFGFLETEIARQVQVIQPYVSNTLKVCNTKIRRILRLEKKPKRKKNRKPKNASKNSTKQGS